MSETYAAYSIVNERKQKMNKNEKIFITFFDCTVEEDSFDGGLLPGTTSQWNNNDLQFDLSREYDSINDALKAVMKANYFDFDKKNWINVGIEFLGDEEDGEYSRFDSDVLVDFNNRQASKSQITSWKKGKTRLFNCHIIVHLEVRSVSRHITEEEAKEWNKE